MGTWRLEPAMIVGVLMAAMSLAISFGVDVSTEQQQRIKEFAEAILILIGAVVIRQNVSPNNKVQAAFGAGALEQVAAVTKAEVKRVP
jgi:uncharacterized membrane protein